MLVKTSLLALTASVLAACAASQQPAAAPEDSTTEAPPASIAWTKPQAEPAPEAATSAETSTAEEGSAAPEAAGASSAAGPAAAASHGEEPRAEGAPPAEQSAVNYIFPEASEGKSQSPINIVTSRAVPRKHKIKFRYRSSKEHVDNLGHTVKVTYDAGSSLEYDGETYDLVQFHFHTPSEHLLDGVTYPMEMHLVHAQHDHPEHLLVVGVLFKEGKASGLLEKLIVNVPERAGEHADKDVKLDASSVFKKGEGYYHYEGSLTTPPYSETVTWLVLDQPHDASAEQIEALNRIEGNNARHIQVQNARLIDHWR